MKCSNCKRRMIVSDTFSKPGSVTYQFKCIYCDIVPSLNKNEKVSVVQDDSSFFEGYVESKTEEHLTIIEYVTGQNRVFRIDDIVEIEKTF